MDTKQAVPMPVIIGVIAVVVIILAVIGYKVLFVPAESGHAQAPASYGQGRQGASPSASSAKP